MDQLEPEKILDTIPNFNEYAQSVSRGLHRLVLEAGSPARKSLDVLHGTWLGHPLHPVLTDAAIGAWAVGGVLDFMAAGSDDRSMQKAADRLTALGTIAAVPTALTGLADYTTIPRRAMTTGAAHGLINITGLILYLLSVRDRAAGRRSRGLFYSAIALGMLMVSAWLGGELAYKYAVGVNKSRKPRGPEAWTPVLNEADLPERAPRRVEVDGHPVLLYRSDGAVYAIGSVCGHDGGPLEQGKFDGLRVECPWHQSVYDLQDGSVVHGPSTYAGASFDARIQDDKVEVRRK